MQCALCDGRAELHLTTVVQRQTRQLHLCARCASEQRLVDEKSQDFSLANALQMMLGQHTLPLDSRLVRLKCPVCDLRYLEFRANGWLGCAHDYPLFRDGILSLLERLHQANTHVGKTPRRAWSAEGVQQSCDGVPNQPEARVTRPRDLFRRKGSGNESG
jgi:protein arginine kinase activator